MTAIIGFNTISIPTSFGIDATAYMITNLHVDVKKKEVMIILEGFAAPETAATKDAMALDKRDYKITTDLSLTEDQWKAMGYIGQATLEQMLDIYIPSINILYTDHVLILPEWAGAEPIEVE